MVGLCEQEKFLTRLRDFFLEQLKLQGRDDRFPETLNLFNAFMLLPKLQRIANIPIVRKQSPTRLVKNAEREL